MTWTWQMTYAIAGPAFALVAGLCVWAADVLMDKLDERRARRSFRQKILKREPQARLSPEQIAALEAALHKAISEFEMPRDGHVSGAR